MNICVAQMRSIKGDIQRNLEKHKKFIDVALAHRADIIIFPELSLTSYEPEWAKAWAIPIADSRLDFLQAIADIRSMIIGVGAPVMIDKRMRIGMIIFQPSQPRQVYLKKYLHPDEEKFFVSGNGTVEFLGSQQEVALAICYELSVPAHADHAYRRGAQVYLASVAKTAMGIEKATPRLSEIAREYSMVALMSNCVGEFDGGVSGGKSSVWDNRGTLMGQLDDHHEGLLILDENMQLSAITF